MVIWIIGLSGAGKTTVGRLTWELWKREEANTVLLDGDVLREVVKANTEPAPYSIEGRRRNAERMVSACEMLDRQGINVVCCTLSLFQDIRDENRERFRDYFEAYLSTPVEVCAERDVKELYAPAQAGTRRDVVGIDIEYTPPLSPDLTLDNRGPLEDTRWLAHRILDEARRSRAVHRQQEMAASLV